MGRSTRPDRPLLTILLTAAMVLSLFAPLGVAGADRQAAETAPSGSADAFIDADADPATIDEELHAADGTVEVILQLEDVDDLVLAQSHDKVGTLQAHAAAAQDPLERYAEATDGVELERTFWITNAVLLTVDTEQVPVEQLARLEGVTDVHENYEVTLPEPVAPFDSDEDTAVGAADSSSHSDAEITASSTVDTTYGLDQINAPDVWEEYGTKGEGVKVAVLDTGVDPDHPDIDIAAENWAEFDSDGNRVSNSDPHDTGDHGTHVSGTVVGGDDSGEYIGVAPEATLMHGLVLNGGSGTGPQVLAGMEWAVEEEADILSMSLGVEGYASGYLNAVRNAREAGVIVVGSSGNNGERTSGSPGNVYDSFAVGAANENGDIAGFSSGEEIVTEDAWGTDAPDHWPDEYIVPNVAAPGVGVKSAIPGDGYDSISGTSMAAPHVSGAMALLLSATESEPDPETVLDSLETTAWKPESEPDEQDTRYGHGIIDIKAATDLVASGVEGTITDSEGQPIEGATVTLGDRTETTDDDGSYRLLAASGGYTVTASAFGYEEHSAVVEIDENEFTTHDVTLEDALAVDVLEAQPAKAKSGANISTQLRTANAETLAVELVGDYDPSNATLFVDGDEHEFGADLNVEDRNEIAVSVETTPGTTGELGLNHTVSAGERTESVETGPTTVFDVETQIAVIDDDDTHGALLADTLAERLPEDAAVVVRSSTDVLETIEQYDAFVVQYIESPIEEFVTATESAGVGAVYLEQAGSESNGISEYGGISDELESVSAKDNDEPPVYYEIRDDHRITDQWTVDEAVNISDTEYSDHAWFELNETSSFDELAAVGDGTDGPAGSALAVDETTNTVLAASLGRTQYVRGDEFTPEANEILATAAMYVAEEPEFDSAAFYGSVDIDSEPASEGDTVTAYVDGEPRGSTDVDAEGRYATTTDPLLLEETVDEGETVTFGLEGLPADQTATVTTDGPELLNLTVSDGTLEGTITETVTGDPIEDATLQLYDGDDAFVTDAHTDGSGDYRFETLPPDNYDLEVHAHGFEDDTKPDIAVSGGPDDGPVVENASLAGDAGFEGTVTDAETGDALVDATVTVTGHYGPYTATTDDQGAYAVDTVPGTGAEYAIEADAADYLPATNSTSLESGETKPVDLSLEPKTLFVEIDAVDTPVITGDSVTVDATVTNTRDEHAATDVALEVDGEQEADMQVDIDPGSSTEVSLTWETDGVDAGEYEAVLTIDGDEASEKVRIHPNVDLEHAVGGTVSSPDAVAERLAVKATDPVELGADAELDIRIDDPETGESVTLSLADAPSPVTGDELRFDVYDENGTITADPSVSVSGTDGNDLDVMVEGDEALFANETFSRYTVSLVDRGDEMTVAETDDRLVGIGYEARLEQDGTTGEINITVPRDESVDESWTAQFKYAELGEDGSPVGEWTTTNVSNDADTDEFAFSLDASDLEAGDYGWELTLAKNQTPIDRILGIGGADADPIVVTEDDDSGGGGGISLPPRPPEGSGPTPFYLGVVDAPAEVDAGAEFSVDAAVKNPSERTTSGIVTVSIDGTTAGSTIVTVPELASESLSFDVVAPDTPGEYELTVETESDQYATDLTVVDPTTNESESTDSDDTVSQEPSDDSGDDDGQPGFGIPAAVVALCLALLLARVTA
ncbi:S8 family serine peptidase [Natronorubrum sp. JWXQ-INN-674]|uniref:S8 family serine peptidase n=1 Tax=Natronorubrum halalkaliphilum TaxID=2691917 RepID=A0A6B0VQX2_9EURY|nr:S8 family serine peptidase [Natronorubrum halalkaliphilum]MXV64201.1 S8 family serine peptidase [Natronorubrum halalkaliphilum]